MTSTSLLLVPKWPSKACHSSMIFIEVFGRFLDGFEMKIDHFWSIFSRFSSTIERR